MQRRMWVMCVLAGVLSAACTGDRQPADAADVVVWNAQVLTVDPQFSTAQAVAIRDGVFTFVGTNEDVKALIGSETRVIDARGRTVVPGLFQTHSHATGAARGEVQQEFVQLHSIGEIQDWVRARAAESPEGTWIQVPRVDVTRIKEGHIPTPADLDAAAPNHPTVYTWSYGVTFSDATAISLAATAFGTVSGVGIRTGSVATTQSVFSTSAAGVTFSAIAFGPV